MKLTFSEKRKRDEYMAYRIQVCVLIVLVSMPVAILAVQAWCNFVTN